MLEFGLNRSSYHSRSLQVLDIELSGNLGRPANLNEEEFVILSSLLSRLYWLHFDSRILGLHSYDATLDFDSAFWEDRHQQSSSRVDAFVLQCRLSIVLARISAKLYGITPHIDAPTSAQLVGELGAELQDWFKTIPPA